MEKQLKPLFINKTEGEWKLIQEKILLSGKKDLSVFIRSEIRKLKNSCENFPHQITCADGEKKTKRPYIPIEQYNEIEIIAKKMKVDVSTVIDHLIISPLLFQIK